MTPVTRTETVTTPDGDFAGHLTLPPAGTGPGLVLIQEIFGVNGYLRAAAARYANLGYVVLCPDVYWRLQPGTEFAHDDAGMGEAFALVQQLDLEHAVADCRAAAAHLRSVPEVRGGVGYAGFCLGGSLGFMAAASGSEAAVVISYYGSAVPERIDALSSIKCPVLFHFGGSDPFISREQVAVVEAAVTATGRDDVRVVVQEAGGHAFDNHEAPGFHDPDAAAAAWTETAAFLAEHLPPTA